MNIGVGKVMSFKELKSAIWALLKYYIVGVLMKKYVYINPKDIESGGGILESDVKIYKTELGFAVDANPDFWAVVIQGLNGGAEAYVLIAKMLEETLGGGDGD